MFKSSKHEGVQSFRLNKDPPDPGRERGQFVR